MKKLITGITLLTSIAFFGQWSSTGDNSTTGNIISYGGELTARNPNNTDASVNLNWYNDIARIRIGGVGSGATNGFEIQGTSNKVLLKLKESGNIGVGTISPLALLDVSTSNGKKILLNFNDESAITFRPNNGNSIFHMSHGHDNKLYISHGSSVGFSKIMTITNNGNVGIGSENPDSKLTVKGKIHCEEVQVDLAVPADYVFEKYYTGTSELKEAYNMPTLEEIEVYTKENHHLPSIPSAKEIQEEGLHLKEMTNLLLQKIEELTLYTIEQEKRINALEGKLAIQK